MALSRSDRRSIDRAAAKAVDDSIAFFRADRAAVSLTVAVDRFYLAIRRVDDDGLVLADLVGVFDSDADALAALGAL